MSESHQPILESLRKSEELQAIGFDSLRPHHVRDILLVASLYDSFTLAEDGRLAEQIFGEFHALSLSAPAYLTRVPTAEKALQMLERRPFDLVITMARVGDLSAQEFGVKAKEMYRDMPVYLMTYDTRELGVLEGDGRKLQGIDKVFVWRGDVRLFLAVIKLVEDHLNVAHDTEVGSVRVIILVEDSIPFYSSYLPLLYEAIMKQTASLMQEGVNTAQKLLRMRARPKILLATSYEEAWDLYQHYSEVLLGVISDVRFPRHGEPDPRAGLELVRNIRVEKPYLPMVLQSSDQAFENRADEEGVTFLWKRSQTLLQEFRQFMVENLGFGEFVFRMPDGKEVARASDLLEMVSVLDTVPEESLRFHGGLNHFSNWLMARTEFSVANVLRTRRVSDFESVEEMRRFLQRTLLTYRQRSRRGLVQDFNAARFDASSEFVRIGGGSLGGKGRGLAFIHELLSRHGVESHFPGLRIYVPPSAVLGTEVFDRFLEWNRLHEFALRENDDDEVTRRFLAARMPRDVVADLAALLDQVRYPLAVRSSSLLEDSHYQPFAGVYSTRMLANADPDPEVRLQQLLDTIKYIYASTFFRDAKAYVAMTPNRMEEEKMAVVIQRIVGTRSGSYVYPHASGTASSYNYYPIGAMKPEEGIACVALGLGKQVVEGGRAVRFSPAHPQSLPQFSRPEDILENAQRRFWALDVTRPVDFRSPDSNLAQLNLAQAERHGMLWPVGSTYSPEDDAVHDGITRQGVRLVTFAPLLKDQIIPFSDVVQLLLQVGQRGLSGPAEIEFALNFEPDGGDPKEFAFLQIRPLPVLETGAPRLDGIDPERVFVRSNQALGHGRSREIRDIVYVRRDRFRRELTPEIASDVGRVNARLAAKERPYLLLGPGRWGTADRWLGIPVSWPQISGARAILECDLDDVVVEPSQGTHFFQNMTSYGIGYFNVQGRTGGTVDREWLEGLPIEEETEWLRHVRLDEPLEVLIDGRNGQGVILKEARDRVEVG